MHPDPVRRHDLDWLRVFACYLLLLFHVGMVFNPAPFYHVRNEDLSVFFLVLCGFISLWHMPLFFLLAGWSAHVSLRSRGAGGFLRERGRKLAIPLAAGCVLLAPGIKYLELRSGLDLRYSGLRVAEDLKESFAPVIPSGLETAEPFDESFVEFLPTFFTDLDRFTWSHLWFLAYLLTFTLVYLPLLRRLLRSRAELSAAHPAWVYAPILPLALVQLTLRPHWPGLQNLYDDWANVAFYSVFLLSGFAMARHPALEETLHREWRRALGIGLASVLVLLAAVLGVVEWAPLLLAGSAVAGWCFVVALLGAARTYLSRPTPAWLTESAFPVYLLHQSAVVLLGYGVVQLPLGIAPKFALLLGGSLALTLAVYHFAVRRFQVTRFLCGMKPLPRAPLAGAAAPAPVRTPLDPQWTGGAGTGVSGARSSTAVGTGPAPARRPAAISIPGRRSSPSPGFSGAPGSGPG